MLILPPQPCPGPREWVMYRRGASPPEREDTSSAQDFRPKPSCFLFWGLWLDHLGDGQWQSSDGL